MKPVQFDASQREALLDLLILGMYADGHLALAEDERLQEFLRQQGVPEVADRQRQLGESVARASRHAAGTGAHHGFIRQLAGRFSRPEDRTAALSTLEQLLRVDGVFAGTEERLWNEVKAALEN